MLSKNGGRSIVETLTPSRAAALISAVCYRMDYEVIPHGGSPSARFGSVQLDAVTICQHDGYGRHHSHRRPQHIRDDGMQDFVVCLPLRGDIQLAQRGRSATLAPGQFALLTIAEPYTASIGSSAPRDPFSCFQVRIASAELRSRVPGIDRHCNQPLEIRRGPGRMMQSLFGLALDQGEGLPGRQALQLRTMLLDAIADSVLDAPELREPASARQRGARTRLFDTASAFIDAHHGDADLDITRIAAHCHVSLRSLQSAFAEAATTVVGTIRERRLLHCRERLRRPEYAQQSVTRIAMATGFNDPAYFSRAYKARFGIAPSLDRGPPALPRPHGPH